MSELLSFFIGGLDIWDFTSRQKSLYHAEVHLMLPVSAWKKG